MSYAEQTTQNRSWIKKFTHQKRFDVAISLMMPLHSENVLDFGAGNGHLLKCLTKRSKTLSIYGYEPENNMFTEFSNNISDLQFKNIIAIKNLNEIGSKRFEIVSCLEVLEHFNEETQRHLLKDIKGIVTENGKIIVSVPIETGLSSLLKNLIRILVKQKHGLTSAKNIFRSLFGLRIERRSDHYINSHIGFNHKTLEKLFNSEGLNIIKKQYSPFKFLYGLLNSQVFYVLTIRHKKTS